MNKHNKIGQEKKKLEPSMIDQTISKIQPTPCFCKVLLEHSSTHFLMCCLWLLSYYDGRDEPLWQKPMVHKVKNIYYLSIYRKSLQTSVMDYENLNSLHPYFSSVLPFFLISLRGEKGFDCNTQRKKHHLYYNRCSYYEYRMKRNRAENLINKI